MPARDCRLINPEPEITMKKITSQEDRSGLFPKMRPLMVAISLFTTTALSLTARAGVDVSRAASWTASGVSFTANGHGSTQNPSVAVWSYFQQAGLEDDGVTKITTLDPTRWTATSFSVSNDNFYLYEPIGGRNRGRVEINSTSLNTFWDGSSAASTLPVPGFMPSWAITSYTETNLGGGTYDIGGSLQWSLANSSSGTGTVVIAKVGVDQSVTELYRQTISSTSMGVFTLFDESSMPSNLLGISLNQGEQLAFSIRGADNRFRGLALLDSNLTLTMATVPEPSTTAVLIGVGAMFSSLASRRGRD